jgi:nicotinate-nucleotide adenylyltransferase
MLKLAIKGIKKFSYSSIEIKRKKVSYTIDTVRHFRNKYKYATLFFLMGIDELLKIYTWKNWKELIKLCQLVVVNRGGWKIRKINNKLNVKFIRVKPSYISSSKIRERIKQGKSIKNFVPSLVESYIYSHNLYKMCLHQFNK